MDGEPAAHQLQCMEIVGGNRTVQQQVEAPGLDIWIDSRPVEGETGGDIHYFSVCGSGRVTRLVIADVTGHGEDAGELAAWLRTRMRKHINLLDQRKFAREINRELSARVEDGRFATVALLTYFAPTDHLIVCNAGHPPPLWYSRQSGQWELLGPDLTAVGEPLSRQKARYLGRKVSNLPLGVIEGTEFVQFAVQLAPDDLVIVTTDGLVEARNDAGKMLGSRGLLDLAAGMDVAAAPRAIADALLEAVAAYREGQPREDDETVAVIRHTASHPPELSLGQLARVLPRVLGLRRV